MASRPLAVALGVTVLLTVARLTGTVDSDVAWQLWIADRLDAGARLYRDIIEVNPPLWFWMARPVEAVATIFHARVEAVLVLAIGGLSAASISATNGLITHIPARRRALVLAYAAVILIGMPWAHLGQREHVALIGTLPYVALITARREGRPVAACLAVLVGAGAAFGFALKHYFLIVPALLELWLLVGLGREWRWRRPETLAVVVVGMAYAAAILLWARDFLFTIVPLIRLSYDMLGPPSARYLFGPFALVGLLILLATVAGALRSKGERTPLTGAMLVAASGFAAIYFIQAKGWTYHAIPLLGCSSLALSALLAESAVPAPFLRAGAPALLLLPLFASVQDARHPGLPTPDLNEAISGLRAGESVGFLAVETAVPWSVSLQHRFHYPSRFMGYWMLNAVIRNEALGNPDPRLARLGRQVVADTVVDFTCAPPRRIIVSRPQPGHQGFDILPFFQRDPRFVALLSHYAVHSRTSFETYERVSAIPAPLKACRRAA